MASSGSALFAFSSKLQMREEFLSSGENSAIFSLHFSSLNPEIDSLQLRFHDIPHARWNGLGPRNSHAVNGRVELPRTGQAAAFALDGRFLLCQSSGSSSLYFENGSFAATVELPAEIHIGYARNPVEAYSLWHGWDRRAQARRAPELFCSPAQLQSPIGFNPKDGAGLLGSLSFSGATQETFQRLNLSIAESAHGPENWKIADLMLCQPDITLPPSFRREIPHAPDASGNRGRASNRYAKIRTGLARYWEFCQRCWEEKGLPALLHPSILIPHDGTFASRDDLLFSGPDFLFAPNLSRQGEVCPLVLPEGEWVHLWTSRVYASGKVTVHAPFGTPALFYRAESEYAWLFDSIRQIASRL